MCYVKWSVLAFILSLAVLSGWWLVAIAIAALGVLLIVCKDKQMCRERQKKRK